MQHCVVGSLAGWLCVPVSHGLRNRVSQWARRVATPRARAWRMWRTRLRTWLLKQPRRAEFSCAVSIVHLHSLPGSGAGLRTSEATRAPVSCGNEPSKGKTAKSRISFKWVCGGLCFKRGGERAQKSMCGRKVRDAAVERARRPRLIF